jgi:hypothetical protein
MKSPLAKRRGMSERAIDYFIARGAERLGEAIKGYWSSRGHAVSVEILQLEPGCERGRNGRAWTITTSLHGGLPIAALPSVTPVNVVRRELARGKSPVEIERELRKRWPNLSRAELRAAFWDIG